VVKLSKGLADAEDARSSSLGHDVSESHLRASGLPFVMLRPVIFMSNFLHFDADGIRSGKLPSVFGDGRMNFVDPEDVAEVTVLALTDDAHVGATWEFGGPEALSYDDVAATFTRVLGHRVEHVRLDEATLRAVAPLPDFVIDAIISSGKLARAGRFTAADDGPLMRLLGRRGRSFADWVERHRSAFSSTGASTR
jgi:uncharacterized protein YbjT (DUF2867 family)